MKRIIFFRYFFIIFLCTLVFACSNESLEEVAPNGTDDPVNNPDPDPNPNPEPDIPDNTATEPCAFDLSGIQANETISIDCVLDLEGKTVNLPENVTLSFDKGDIFNGTINFGTGGKIAGELLSSKLTLEGDVQLINPIFKFFASRWDVVEGTTTSDIALENTKKLEDFLMPFLK